MRSLKRTLVVWVTCSSIVLSIAAGVLLYLMIADYLTAQFDASLVRKARLLASTIEIEIDVLELGFEDLDMSEFDSPQAGGYLQVYHRGGSLFRSPSLDGYDLPEQLADTDITRVIPVALPGNVAGRGILCKIQPIHDVFDPNDIFEDEQGEDAPAEWSDDNGDVSVTLCLARDTREIDERLAALRLALFGVGALLAIALSGLTYLMVGRCMRPVDDLAQRVSELNEKTLNQRLATSNIPAELLSIVEQFNGLMGRLHSAFERERGFSADIAHELRTPLAGLRTTLDVARAKPRDEQAYRQCLDRLHVMTVQMQALIESLLQLAKLERGLLKPARQSVNPDDLLRNLWQSVRDQNERAEDFTHSLDLQTPGPIQTDPALLSIVLRNVLQNAAHYTNNGGNVSIASNASSAGLMIEVANSGSRVAENDAPKVFDRFWRADEARHDTGARFGLGLALARQATEAIGGRIAARSQPDGRFVITITLPA